MSEAAWLLKLPAPANQEGAELTTLMLTGTRNGTWLGLALQNFARPLICVGLAPNFLVNEREK